MEVRKEINVHISIEEIKMAIEAILREMNLITGSEECTYRFDVKDSIEPRPLNEYKDSSGKIHNVTGCTITIKPSKQSNYILGIRDKDVEINIKE